MLIDLIVGSAIALFGLYLASWLASPALRNRIEAPKYTFMRHARSFDERAPDPVIGETTAPPP